MKKLFTTTMLTLGMALATASASAALTQQQEDKILEKLKPEIDALVLDMVGGEKQYFTGKDGKRVHLPKPIDPKEEAIIAAKLDEIAKKKWHCLSIYCSGRQVSGNVLHLLSR